MARSVPPSRRTGTPLQPDYSTPDEVADPKEHDESSAVDFSYFRHTKSLETCHGENKRSCDGKRKPWLTPNAPEVRPEGQTGSLRIPGWRYTEQPSESRSNALHLVRVSNCSRLSIGQMTQTRFILRRGPRGYAPLPAKGGTS